jgi:hypothetical protein
MGLVIELIFDFSFQILNSQEEIVNESDEKLKSTDNEVSELGEIFNRAQITTITQIGLARQHLAKEALKKSHDDLIN